MRSLKITALSIFLVILIIVTIFIFEKLLILHPLIKVKNDIIAEKRYIDLREATTKNEGFILGDEELKENHEKIFFIGGSSVLCNGIDISKRYPYYSSKLMREKTNINYYGINAGQSGNHSMHNNFVILAKILKHYPKYVFLSNSVNDLGFLTKTKSYWSQSSPRSIIKKPFKADTEPGLIFKIRKILPNTIYLLDRIVTDFEIDEFRDYKFTNFKKEDFVFIEEQFKRSLDTAVSILKKNKIEPILIVQANRLKIEDGYIKNYYNNIINNRKNIETSVSYEDFVEYYIKFNNIIREIAKNENILLIDLDAEIPKNEIYISDAVHLTREGSILAAEIIAKKFLEENHSN